MPTTDAPAAAPALTPWQELAFNSSIARAIEISLAGCHSLRLIGHPGNGAQYLSALVNSLACTARIETVPRLAWWKPCACGYLGDPAKDCSCSPRLCERFTRRIHATPFDINLRVIQPRAYQLTAREHCEPFDAVLNRIEARAPLRDAIPETLDLAGGELLSRAYDALGFTLDQRTRVLSVARTIAALSGSPVIRVSHIAESIQYQDVRI